MRIRNPWFKPLQGYFPENVSGTETQQFSTHQGNLSYHLQQRVSIIKVLVVPGAAGWEPGEPPMWRSAQARNLRKKTFSSACHGYRQQYCDSLTKDRFSNTVKEVKPNLFWKHLSIKSSIFYIWYQHRPLLSQKQLLCRKVRQFPRLAARTLYLMDFLYKKQEVRID